MRARDVFSHTYVTLSWYQFRIYACISAQCDSLDFSDVIPFHESPRALGQNWFPPNIPLYCAFAVTGARSSRARSRGARWRSNLDRCEARDGRSRGRRSGRASSPRKHCSGRVTRTPEIERAHCCSAGVCHLHLFFFRPRSFRFDFSCFLKSDPYFGGSCVRWVTRGRPHGAVKRGPGTHARRREQTNTQRKGGARQEEYVQRHKRTKCARGLGVKG